MDARPKQNIFRCFIKQKHLSSSHKIKFQKLKHLITKPQAPKTYTMIPASANILVVGAGPSGLVALKELRESGLNAIAIDQRAEFGGVFAPSSGVTYEKLYLTTTNMFMAFSDFPPEDKKVKYWSKQEYFEYLESYVNHFDLDPYIHLETTVKNAKLNPSTGKWQVRFAANDESTQDRAFDYLVVATGANHKPYLPSIFEGFTGEIIHSHEYHSPEQVQGKKVLVVGGGESSADVIVSSATTAENVTAWNRKMPGIAPRFLTDIMEDPNYSEANYLPNQEKVHRKPCDFLEAATTSRIIRNLPLAAWAYVLQKGLCEDLKALHPPNTPGHLLADWNQITMRPDFFNGDHSSVPTKCAMICTAAAEGKMELVISPRFECEGQKVKFLNPTYYKTEEINDSEDIVLDEVDVVVACTGYQIQFDWLEAPGLETNPRFWFKHSIPTNDSLARKIAFLGYARPHQGGIPQCSEMVARYIAQLIINPKCSLPLNYKELALSEGTCEEECFHLSRHCLPLVDYNGFMLSLSCLIGCEPEVPMFDPSAMVKYWTFPLWSCFFRTAGIGAKPETCEAVLEKFGTFDGLVPMPLLGIEICFTFLMPFVNALYYMTSLVLGKPTKGLPAGYKWRFSKTNMLSGNALQMKDFLSPVLAQFGAGLAVIWHGLHSFAAKHSLFTPLNHKKVLS